MDPNSEHIKEIFWLALEKKAPAERSAYLAEACQANGEMRQQIESLIFAHEHAGEFLGQTIKLPASSFATERAGTMIGRYKLLEIIGEGGYGTVWMAEQVEPVRRRVALKVIKAGMDTKQVLARFEAERQALAMMDHPCIARVFDGGATEAGRPFFVMELVRGARITDYCDANKLSTSQRLALFIQVCQAVQHAHQKGIIHRDLKPSNILVTEVDGAPVPKVIDFGVAKAMQAALTEHTLFTGLHQMIGTPAYMSPEQAGLGALDMDTRSDIYALGVLLYELLTGQTPINKEEYEKAGMDEILRLVREEDPPKPSTRLSALTREQLTTIAVLRQAEPVKLNRLLAGDLDWIVMKSLEKDRRRRYESAATLAQDVERHLSHEPVAAAPPSWSYLFGKTLRKHRRFVAVAAALAFLLVAGAVLSLWQADRAMNAEKSAKSARQVAELSSVQARENARKATESEQGARSLLYASDMRVAFQAWADGNLSFMVKLLDAHQPAPGQPDPRGFEYFHLRQLAKGEQEWVLSGHTNAVLGIAISPNGQWLASRSPTETRLWHLPQRALAAAWPSSGPAPSSPAYATAARYGISFSYDSQFVAIETSAGLQLGDVSTGQTHLLRTGEGSRPSFSPVTNLLAFNANLLSGLLPPKIVLWDYLADKEVATTEGGEIWCWSQDGSRLLTDQGGYDVHFWEVPSLRCVMTNRNVGKFVFGAALSRDGAKMAVAEWSGAIHLLAPDGTNVSTTLASGGTSSSALAFSPDSKTLATSGANQAILLFDSHTGKQQSELRGHRGEIHALAYSPDGKLLASGGEDSDVMLWNPASSRSQLEISNQMGFVLGNPPQFSPDGKSMALAYDGNSSQILDSSSLLKKASLTGAAASFSPDGSQVAALACGVGAEFILKTVDAGSNRATIHTDSAGLRLITSELSPDGAFVSFTTMDMAGYGATGSLLCDAFSGEKILSVATNSQVSVGHCFLPDGSSWVYMDGSKIRFWDLRSRQNTRSFECHQAVLRLAISDDGKVLAASRKDYSILLWDLLTGAELGSVTGPQAEVWGLALSADGRTMASGGADCTLKFWNIPTLREVASLPQDQPVCWLAFSPDNQILVLGGLGSYHVLRAPRENATPWGAPALPMKDLSTNSIWRAPDGARPLSPSLVAQLREEADHGGADSRYLFGRMFQRGEDVPKDMDEALKWYQKAEAADGYSLNRLAWSLATSHDLQWRDITNAVRYARKAVALTPISEIWNTLGVAQYRAGDFKQAIRALEKSMQSGGHSDGCNLFFLAMAHHRLDETDAGRDCYARGIQ